MLLELEGRSDVALGNWPSEGLAVLELIKT